MLGRLLAQIIFLARRAMMDEHAQVGREARQLALPVAHHRGGTDQQRGTRLRVDAFVQQQRDQLNRFAQTHIVGQTRAQTPLPQKHQPRQSHRLIRPQLPAKIDRDGHGLHLCARG